MTKIFIAEEIPSLNKGEAAILFGMIESFRTLGDVEVSLLSFHLEIDRPRYGDKVNMIDGIKDLHLINGFDRSTIVRLFESAAVLLQCLSFMMLCKIFGLDTTKIMKKEIWKEYCESDLIIIGHDSAFSGLFGVVPFLQLYSLFIAKIIKKPIAIYGGSAGIFESKLQFIIAKFILNRVDIITLRDETSYKYLQDIGITTQKIMTADLAYLLQPAPLTRVEEIIIQENKLQNNKI